eukprot:SAG31_NODE_459_length_15396_cov_5.092502_16_plen_95_part_00
MQPQHLEATVASHAEDVNRSKSTGELPHLLHNLLADSATVSRGCPTAKSEVHEAGSTTVLSAEGRGLYPTAQTHRKRANSFTFFGCFDEIIVIQ